MSVISSGFRVTLLKINLTGEAVVQQAAPAFRTLHVGGSLALVHIEVDEGPIGTEPYRIDKLLLVIIEVVGILGLVEESDVDADPVMIIGARTLVRKTGQPCFVLGNLSAAQFFLRA